MQYRLQVEIYPKLKTAILLSDLTKSFFNLMSHLYLILTLFCDYF